MKYYRPIQTRRINQAWGVKDPLYQQFGFSLHNGTDYPHSSSRIIHAPCDGTIVRTGNQPNGGGIFCGLIDCDTRYLVDFLHCEKLLVSEGQYVHMGDKLAIQGNTGLSSGPHTHIQVRPVASWNGQSGSALQWAPAIKNDANNSIDPETIWEPEYAVDVRVKSLLEQAVLLAKELVGKFIKT